MPTKLLPGARLYDGSGSSTLGRLSLSAGTVAAQAAASDRFYRHGACIPRGPWRAPSSEELELLLLGSSSDWDSRSTLAVVSVDQALLDCTRHLLVRLEEGGLSRAAFAQESRAAMLAKLETLIPLCESADDLSYIGCACNDAGLITVTGYPSASSPARACYLGLHFDYPSAPAPRPRWNRLCINLGSGPRDFLFINLDLDKVLNAVQSHSEQGQIGEATPTLSDLFCQLHPDYPVVRVRIFPGEAYIAPTYWLIHDATTVGKQELDVCLHWLGRFTPVRQSS